MTLSPNPDPLAMRHTLTLLCGSLRSLAPRIEVEDESAAAEIRELAALAASAAGIAFEDNSSRPIEEAEKQ